MATFKFLISKNGIVDIKNWIADICNCFFTSETSP